MNEDLVALFRGTVFITEKTMGMNAFIVDGDQKPNWFVWWSLA